MDRYVLTRYAPGGVVRLGILGPLLVAAGTGREVHIPAARQRILLATLLAYANQALPVDTLAETVWDGAPPVGAAGTLRTYVMRLRNAVGATVAARIVTREPGYLCQVAEDELDVLRFESLCGATGAALHAAAWSDALTAAAGALALWRGAPLLDAPSQALCRVFVPRFEQLRLQVLENRAEAGLRLGDHDRLVPQLRELTAAHPLRERFHAQLMLALVHSGRQAEALAAYRDARRVLVEELGLEPGPELKRLHERILAGDVELTTPSPSDREVIPVRAACAPAPRQLPAAAWPFTGRQRALDLLTGFLDESAKRAATGGTVVISAIDGMAGVGKTALAVRWAHEVADRFPDGQLYVNLRGYDADRPMPVAEALAGFLRALGMTGQDIPAEVEQRAAAYRSLVAGRRILVVLDNAGTVEAVRPLLPGSATCVALVTSRNSLAGLVARDGAHRLVLDLLTQSEAVELLRQLLGRRVAAEPDAAAALATRCCRLPLALRVAAERVTARPDAPLAVLTDELADLHGRLDLLDAGGDVRTAVRVVLSWSYHHLDEAARQVFRMVSLHPGADFEYRAVAALVGMPNRSAARKLEELARVHMIQRLGRDRYGMHDLLRAYGRERADDEDHEHDRRVALTNLFDHYLHGAAIAMDALFPAETGRRPRVVAPAVSAGPFTDPADARAWLDAERANLVQIVAYASGRGWPGHAGRLGVTLFRYLDSGGHLAEGAMVHGSARRAAAEVGDRGAEATALANLAIVELRQGRRKLAAKHLRWTLHWFRETGDREAEARALHNLGVIEYFLGRFQRAARHLQRALELYAKIGEQLGEARTATSLAIIMRREGRYREAIAHLRRALTVCRTIGDRLGEAEALVSLGIVELCLGHCTHAGDHQRLALSVFRDVGDRLGEAEALTNLGMVELRQGHHEQAAEHTRQALELCRALGDPSGEAEALTNVGLVALHAGRHEQAAHDLSQAVALYHEIGERLGEAEARNGLGEVCHATGRPEQARAYHADALLIADAASDFEQRARAHRGLSKAFAELGAPVLARHHADQARAIHDALDLTAVCTPDQPD